MKVFLLVATLLTLVYSGGISCDNSNSYVLATGETPIENCDGMRICQASCNSPRYKCVSNDANYNRGQVKQLDGRSYFLPPYPLEIQVVGLNQAYDLACIRHSSSKSHLLKLMDNVRKVAERNMTRVSATAKQKQIDKEAKEKAQQDARKGQIKGGKRTLEADALKWDWKAAPVVEQRQVDKNGRPKGGKFAEERQMEILQAVVALMDPKEDFFKFWYTMKEYCKRRIDGLVPRDRALRAFFTYYPYFSVKTQGYITQLNVSAPVEPTTAPGGKKIPANSGSVDTRQSTGQESKDRGDINMMEWIKKEMDKQSKKGGAAVLNRGHRMTDDEHCAKMATPGEVMIGITDDAAQVAAVRRAGFLVINPGNNHGNKKEENEAERAKRKANLLAYCSVKRGVIDLFWDLADWATAAKNYRCPCSDIQTLIFTGIAPDGTAYPDIKKLYDGPKMLEKRDQACQLKFSAVCKPRANGDYKDVSDDGLFVATPQAAAVLEVQNYVQEKDEGVLELETN